MPRIIHVAYPVSTPHLSAAVFPPTPPQSPRRRYGNEDHKLSSSIMWQPAWHMVMGAQTSHDAEHTIVSLGSQQPSSYHIDYLNPLFQSNPTSSAISEKDVNSNAFRQFLDLNYKFAEQVIDQHRSENDIIWLHDYALVLLPALLRQKLPKATIALAIYAHFPTLDSRIPEHLKILQSMLAADLVVFQMKRDIDSFKASCAGPIPPVCLLRQSVAIQQLPSSRSIRNIAATTTNNNNHNHIVLCHDTDAAFIPHTLAAIDRAAALDPSLTFVHIRPSSSHPSSATTNILTYDHNNLNPEEYLRLLATADATLVMGHSPAATVAAQACLTYSTAPLVVSSSSPLASHATLAVDDSEMDAHTIITAVDAPRRAAPLDANNAAPRMVTELIRHVASSTHKTPLLNTSLLAKAYQHSRRRLLLFDYDGTLTPIVPNPDDARPTPALLHYLQTLCNDPTNVVWVVSGRDQATLEAWLGKIEGLGLSAEHGSFMKHPDQSMWIDMLAQASPDMMQWQAHALDVFSDFTAKTPGTVVEQKKASITWHYRNALDPQLALAQVEACYNRLTDIEGVDILRGKMNLEVRSLLVNKGHVVRRIQQQVAADFILCAGDDRTDEDMFRALSNYSEAAHCVHIGPRDVDTLAQWSVESSEQFVACLGQLSSQLKNSAL